VVTGASRGIGKGVALGLGEAGATVHLTGRSVRVSEDARGSPE
jgi:NAD(P)-dependent dehydrogenase (short-subunit alcohol dehydrogenase family)